MYSYTVGPSYIFVSECVTVMVDHFSSSVFPFTASVVTMPLVRLEERLSKMLNCQAQICKLTTVVSMYTRTNIDLAMHKNTTPSFSAAR